MLLPRAYQLKTIMITYQTAVCCPTFLRSVYGDFLCSDDFFLRTYLEIAFILLPLVYSHRAFITR